MTDDLGQQLRAQVTCRIPSAGDGSPEFERDLLRHVILPGAVRYVLTGTKSARTAVSPLTPNRRREDS